MNMARQQEKRWGRPGWGCSIGTASGINGDRGTNGSGPAEDFRFEGFEI